jgi:arylsulfatase A-like enzyme
MDRFILIRTALLAFWLIQRSTTVFSAEEHPNILWITSEDNSPYLGCFGDPIARTPRLDRLASEGIRYVNCFSNAAVCGAARQTLISGMMATSIGGQHMRSDVDFPKGVPFFPKYLRDAGYYTTNNSKTDYNGGPPGDRKAAMSAAWNDSSNKAHWRNRPGDKPFFAVFNIGTTHESGLFPNRWRSKKLKTDPATVQLPAYLPDTVEARRDLARYYDNLETMDAQVGAILDQLEEDGLADDTIVFYYSDHGGSLPRGKSYIYDSGTHVPFILRVPEKWKALAPGKAGSQTDRLISFVDFAPTMLSLIGKPGPAYMQGRAFLGNHAKQPRDFVHLFRGRRGARYDLVRGVRDKEFLYIRNYSPHLPVMQPNAYSWPIPSYPAWRRAWLEGTLPKHQSIWFEPKPSEELYRISDDPDNVINLAGDSAQSHTLRRFREEHRRHTGTIRDSVFFPEGISGRTYEAYQDEEQYLLEKLWILAEKATDRNPDHVKEFRELMKDDNPCIRWWAITGCVMLGKEAERAADDLQQCLKDTEPTIRIQAAKALAHLGKTELAIPVLKEYLKQDTFPYAMQAALAVDEAQLESFDMETQNLLEQVKEPYVNRVTEWILEMDPERSK